MRQIELSGVGRVPALGQGTWKLGEDRAQAASEREALLAGVDAGMTLIDTAEMYGDGSTETFLGEALAGRRDQVFLVSKAYPQNASRERLPTACEASLRRLRTDRLDLYLLHWRGSVPIDETVQAMHALKKAGKIRAWGVSNFDVDDMEELVAAGGDDCACNQVLYNIARRGPEYDLVPWLALRHVSLMAYSPVEQGRLPHHPALCQVAEGHGVSPYQAALAWVMRNGAIAIPKAATLAHVRENRIAADLALTHDDLAALEADFAPPPRKVRLAML